MSNATHYVVVGQFRQAVRVIHREECDPMGRKLYAKVLTWPTMNDAEEWAARMRKAYPDTSYTPMALADARAKHLPIEN